MNYTSTPHENVIIMSLTRDLSDYNFYANLVSQMVISEDKNIDTAGVTFKNSKYYFYYNKDFFESLPLNQQKGLIKHECLHVLNKHLTLIPEEDYNFQTWNQACDIAINQQIIKEDLPEGGLTPEDYKLDKDLTAKQYYFLLKEQEDEKENEENNEENNQDSNGSSDDDSSSTSSNNSNSNSNSNSSSSDDSIRNTSIDDHSLWEEAKESDEELINDVTSSLIDKSMKKSKGTIPSDLGSIIELFRNKAKVSWKRVLRKYTGNKRANTRNTIKKRNRRFPNRLDIGGKTKDYTYNVLVVVDVSGSMNDTEIVSGLSEINHICKLTNSDIDIIQVDSKAYPSEKFNNKKTEFTRKASGGTKLYPAIEQANKEKIDYNVVVVISDMGLFDEDIKYFNSLKVPQIWLDTYNNEKNQFSNPLIRVFSLEE